jgi:hypothetical protein
MSIPPSKEASIWRKVAPSLLAPAIVSLVTTLIPGGWTWVFGCLKVLWQWVKSPVSLPVWVPLLLSVLLIAAFVAALKRACSAILKTSPRRNFTECNFLQVRWRWNYDELGNIVRLASFCPKCDMQVHPTRIVPQVGDGSPITYHCDECQDDVAAFDITQDEVEDRVIRLIQKRIRSAEENRS